MRPLDTHTHTPKLSGILEKILKLYTDWNREVKRLPKDLRYSIGLKIGALFTDVIEQASLAQFSSSEKYKVFYIDRTIAKNDTLKFMFYTLHELQGISEVTFADTIIRTEEVGKMLYGWKRKLEEKAKTGS